MSIHMPFFPVLLSTDVCAHPERPCEAPSILPGGSSELRIGALLHNLLLTGRLLYKVTLGVSAGLAPASASQE